MLLFSQTAGFFDHQSIWKEAINVNFVALTKLLWKDCIQKWYCWLGIARNAQVLLDLIKPVKG